MQDDQEQEIEVPEDDQTEDTEPPAGDESQGDEDEKEPEEGDDEQELEVSFGDEKEAEPEPESELLTDLRQRHRSLKKKLRKTLHELEEIKKPQVEKPIDPGPKPTLESCDYDSDQYEAKLSDWFEVKRKAARAAEEAAARQEEDKKAQQKIYENYNERRQSLKIKDFKEAEEEVVEALDVMKQNVILKYAKKPELIVYALGKNPAKLRELSKMDAFEFAKELGRLEDKLKVGKRKPKTQPEKTISSTGTLSGTTDRTLEKLRAEAEKTGNYTKVNDYRRRKRKAG